MSKPTREEIKAFLTDLKPDGWIGESTLQLLRRRGASNVGYVFSNPDDIASPHPIYIGTRPPDRETDS